MSADGDFEVRNRHGDVVQRGEIEITDVHELPFGRLIEFEYQDPAHMRNGDSLSTHIDLSELD